MPTAAIVAAALSNSNSHRNSNRISSLLYGASSKAGGVAPHLPTAFNFRLLLPWDIFVVLSQVAVGQEQKVTDIVTLTRTKQAVDK